MGTFEKVVAILAALVDLIAAIKDSIAAKVFGQKVDAGVASALATKDTSALEKSIES